MGDFTNAIPTIYRGVQLKSRLESQAALLFDRCGWEWEYETKSYMLPNGVNYTPDFWLPELKAVVEPRGYDSRKGKSQIEGFSEIFTDYGVDRFVVLGPDKCVVFGPAGPTQALIGFCDGCGRMQIVPDSELVCYCPTIYPDCPEVRNLRKLEISKGRLLLSGSEAQEWTGFDKDYEGFCYRREAVADRLRWALRMFADDSLVRRAPDGSSAIHVAYGADELRAVAEVFRRLPGAADPPRIVNDRVLLANLAE